MELTQENLLQIENHIKDNLISWMEDTSFKRTRYFSELELVERIVRVEEELKSQRELIIISIEQMEKRFEQMEKRFEQVDKRFEQMDKRFEDIQKYMDKRFEQVDKRFEQVDKRFEDVNSKSKMMFAFMTLGFTILATMMTVFKFLT